MPIHLGKPSPYRKALEAHTRRWQGCTECGLCSTRTHVVLFRGCVPSDIVFIGEAPGVVENDLGLPFTGPSGKLLDSILDEVAERTSLPSRKRLPTYSITNVVACIPRDLTNHVRADNKVRPPTEEEIHACSPRLLEFLNIAKPSTIILVGKIAGKAKVITKLKPVPTIHTMVHPAYMLRSGGKTSVEYRRSVLTLTNIFQGLVK